MPLETVQVIGAALIQLHHTLELTIDCSPQPLSLDMLTHPLKMGPESVKVDLTQIDTRIKSISSARLANNIALSSHRDIHQLLDILHDAGDIALRRQRTYFARNHNEQGNAGAVRACSRIRQDRLVESRYRLRQREIFLLDLIIDHQRIHRVLYQADAPEILRRCGQDYLGIDALFFALSVCFGNRFLQCPDHFTLFLYTQLTSFPPPPSTPPTALHPLY